jgi:predicted DNA-binding transcriptional regulator YafY
MSKSDGSGFQSERFLQFLAKLLQQRSEKTIDDLRVMAGVSNATIYRWIRLVERYFPQAVQIDYGCPGSRRAARVKVGSIYG